MSSRLRIIAFATTGLALMLCESVTAGALPKLTAEQTQIVDTVSTIFTAARTDDVAKFDSVIAPDFYIFDAGARFNGDSIMAFIKAQHLAGKRYEWNVTEPDVHINGKTAWVAYVNKGSVGDAAGTAESCPHSSQKRSAAGRALPQRGQTNTSPSITSPPARPPEPGRARSDTSVPQAPSPRPAPRSPTRPPASWPRS